MADIDTQLTSTWGPSLPAPAVTDTSVAATLGWPMRRGAQVYAGTVTWNGSPAVRRVVLLDQQSLSVLDVTLSAADGTWSLGGWDGSYAHICMCIDSAGAYQAIAYDRV